ncbi:hypothetical protein FA95DRAFT_741953 [Auriscalpium vulgare]|uniref:Uncharacterized protein n=1 Tax=Auriscalpium vulgare TaxID=40419 RepID=A0ACB8SBW0_9AGAM|nr:hypothetical protein FA95DRAFT_741953 [Auriscalpium vulgare]
MDVRIAISTLAAAPTHAPPDQTPIIARQSTLMPRDRAGAPERLSSAHGRRLSSAFANGARVPHNSWRSRVGAIFCKKKRKTSKDSRGCLEERWKWQWMHICACAGALGQWGMTCSCFGGTMLAHCGVERVDILALAAFYAC